MVQTCVMGCMHGSDSVIDFSVHSLCFETIYLYNELYAWFRQCDGFLSTKPVFSEHSPL